MLFRAREPARYPKVEITGVPVPTSVLAQGIDDVLGRQPAGARRERGRKGPLRALLRVLARLRRRRAPPPDATRAPD